MSLNTIQDNECILQTTGLFDFEVAVASKGKLRVVVQQIVATHFQREGSFAFEDAFDFMLGDQFVVVRDKGNDEGQLLSVRLGTIGVDDLELRDDQLIISAGARRPSTNRVECW